MKVIFHSFFCDNHDCFRSFFCIFASLYKIQVACLEIFDVGLLGAMAEIDPASLILPNEMKEGKGMLTENFVCTQLAAGIEQSIFYYSKENSPLEIDFMIQDGSGVVPIEVKSEENLKSKSLSAFLGQNANAHGVRFSMSPYRDQERMTNVPLYGAGVYFDRG